jgi:hypothetical protein
MIKPPPSVGVRANVDAAGWLFFAGAWLIILIGVSGDRRAGGFLLRRGRSAVAVAILTTGALPRWIGWLGLLVGALAGWLGLLSPAASVIASISNIGFIGFFVFMLTMGIALLRRRSKIDEATQASAQAPS